nr:uncharacterized protein LOC123494838 [Aegilops tauschii subsp. strangulata]
MTAIMSGTITTTAPATTTTTADPPPLLTPEEVSGTLRELVQAVRGITLYLAGNQPLPPSAATTAYGPPLLQWPTPAFQAPYGGAPPPPLLLPHYPAAGTPWPAWPTATASLGATVQQHHQAPLPSTAPPPASRPTSRPLHQVQFPPSPSPIPAWAAGSSPDPVYTTAPEHPMPSLRFDRPSSSANYAPEIPDPAHALPLTAAPGHGGPTPPRFAKLDFATYDGMEDPLNWLNQCERFFRGQRTLASDRTWLASYHLRGAAQTWYYALEQDEGGMPPWERFRELCLLRFGPPIRGSRLAALGRLPFTSTVQDYADRFQALACHAPGVSATQRAELFVGGLPDHIRVDVELRDPPDLQTAMYYARAFEQRAQALQQPAGRGGRHPSRPAPTPPSPGRLPPATTTAPPATTRTFRRLSPAEQEERRRQGLCFNCDEPYTPTHVCPRLFYLETVDYTEADDSTDEPPPAAAVDTPADSTATACVVSLHALAGIRGEQTMLLPVTVHGERLVALLDTGSTHNFLPAATMRRLALPTTDGERLRITVANGDRLRCHALARDVPISIGGEHFSITCAGIDLGCFDFILGVDFLRTLGPILWDFDALLMTFWRLGRRIRWDRLGGAAPAVPHLQLAAASQEAEHPLLDPLLQQHSDIFDEPRGLPPAQVYDHHIHLVPGSTPVAVRPYRYPQLQKDKLERQCALMLAAGIIRISTSPFSAPVLLVRKSDGTWRFCIDYRALNALTLKDKFPIPVVDELLDELHGARFFTKSSISGRAIISATWAEHLQHVTIVFNELRVHHLHLKRSKCSFGTPTVAYLGRVISADGVAMDADKVAAVSAWPTPHSPRALRGFLGLAGYYRKFIREFGLIAAPLTRLLRRDAFAWDDEGTTAFEALKGALTTGPVLQMPDFDRPFVVDYDASGAGFGAAVRHWRPYLWGRSFHIRTDHYSLKFLLDQWLSTVPQHQWISKLFDFDFSVEYRPGRLNIVADALSRRDSDLASSTDESAGAALCIRFGPTFGLFADIHRATATADDAVLLQQQLTAGDLEEPWRFSDGLLLHGRRIFVPAHDDLRHQVLQLAHSAGHEGVQKTLHRLRADFYIPGDRALVRD